MKTLKIEIKPLKREKVKFNNPDLLKEKILDAIINHLETGDTDIKIKNF